MLIPRVCTLINLFSQKKRTPLGPRGGPFRLCFYSNLFGFSIVSVPVSPCGYFLLSSFGLLRFSGQSGATPRLEKLLIPLLSLLPFVRNVTSRHISSTPKNSSVTVVTSRVQGVVTRAKSWGRRRETVTDLRRGFFSPRSRGFDTTQVFRRRARVMSQHKERHPLHSPVKALVVLRKSVSDTKISV